MGHSSQCWGRLGAGHLAPEHRGDRQGRQMAVAQTDRRGGDSGLPHATCQAWLQLPLEAVPPIFWVPPPEGRRRSLVGGGWAHAGRGAISQVGTAQLEARSQAPPGFRTAQPPTPTQAKPKHHSGLHPGALGDAAHPRHQRALWAAAGLRAQRAPCTRQRRCTQAQQTQRLCACSAAQSTHRRIRMHVWHNSIMRTAVHVCKCDSACGHVCECTGAHV